MSVTHGSRWRSMGRAAAWMVGLAAVGAAGASSSCTRRQVVDSVVDATMTSAYRADPLDATAASPAARGHGGRLLLAGDLHCHVSPPDDPSHVSRGVAETVELARDERLDFVMLTPHVASRFFQDAGERAEVVAAQRRLAAALDRAGTGGVLFVRGFEYTDYRYGHVGAGLVDLERVLADVPVDVARRHPARFFEAIAARGGVIVVNHPLVTPLDSMISMARADLSWRPWTARGPFPPEIRAANRLAHGFEAYNLTATHLRDRWLVGDTERTLRGTLARLDREIVTQRRRIAPVGGSDSHSSHLRATTFVLADSRTEAGVREALRAGRVCVRSPEACSLEARVSAESPWLGLGDAIEAAGATGAAAPPTTIEARATGEDVELYLDGATVGTPASGEPVRFAVPPRCSVLRARVGEGFSAPIYVNCGF